MTDRQITNLIEETLIEKRIKDSNFIRYSYYELRVKYNLSSEETDKFMELTRNKLLNEDENYRVYFTGAKFEYKNAKMTVQDNELLIAVKD